MGQAIGLYFRGLDKEGVNALRARLNRRARELDYTAQAGPTTGAGNLAALLIGIDAGEAVVVQLDTETVEQTIAWLRRHACEGEGASIKLFKFLDALEQSQK